MKKIKVLLLIIFLFLSIACVQDGKIEKSKKGKVTFQELKVTVNKNGLPEYHIYTKNGINDVLDDTLINALISEIYDDYKMETPSMTIYLYFDKEATENVIRMLSVVTLEIRYHKLVSAVLSGVGELSKDEYQVYKTFEILGRDKRFNSEEEVIEVGAVKFNMEPNKFRETVNNTVVKIIENSRDILN